MLTAIVSDLHLGAASGADVARRPTVLAKLAEALADADRVVVLGDLLEMRERPASDVLDLARPVLETIGEASAGKQLVLVPGNHDHELVSPALDAARLERRGPLALEATFDASSGELSRRVAAAMPRTEVVLAYPGIRLRDDVFATHGHYLDVHLTVPRLECVLASAVARIAGALREGGTPTPDGYEAALAPLYAFAYSVVQQAPARAVTRGGNASRAIWSRANSGGRASLTGMALGRIAIPGAVAAVNALGLGPFRADISGLELRRAGLRAMARVVQELGIESDHVLFGHTHRAGPLPGEVEGWHLPGGARLHNTGSWVYEDVFLGGTRPSENPYWPGCVTFLRDEGAPFTERVVSEFELSTAG